MQQSRLSCWHNPSQAAAAWLLSQALRAARCAGLDEQHALHSRHEEAAAPMDAAAAQNLPSPRDTAAMAPSPPSTPVGEMLVGVQYCIPRCQPRLLAPAQAQVCQALLQLWTRPPMRMGLGEEHAVLAEPRCPRQPACQTEKSLIGGLAAQLTRH